MIKDCEEDRYFLMLIRGRKFNDDKPKHRPDSRTKNLGHGIPTVEEVDRFSDLYYGPPKVWSRPLHGSI